MDYGPEDAAKDRAEMSAEYAHILTDLHGLAQQLAGLVAVVEEMRDDLLNPMYGQLSEIRAQVDELAPAARRAAAMLDTPVTAFLAARKETDGRDQRAGTRTGRGRRARPAGR